jgi:hypothetical protein
MDRKSGKATVASYVDDHSNLGHPGTSHDDIMGSISRNGSK